MKQTTIFSLACRHISCRVSRLTDLGPANTCGSVLKVYNPIGIGGTGFGVELYGPVLLHVLSRTRIEGYGGRGLLPDVLPNQTATTTSGQWKDNVTECGRGRLLCFDRDTIHLHYSRYDSELIKSRFLFVKHTQNQGSVVRYDSLTPDLASPFPVSHPSSLPPFVLESASLCF